MNEQGTLFDVEVKMKSAAVDPRRLVEFEKWLQRPNGKKIWQGFMDIAVNNKRKGKRFGARAICEYLRYREDIPKDIDGHRMNNNWIALMARKAMDEIKELEGYFELRECKLGKEEG